MRPRSRSRSGNRASRCTRSVGRRRRRRRSRRHLAAPDAMGEPRAAPTASCASRCSISIWTGCRKRRRRARRRRAALARAGGLTLARRARRSPASSSRSGRSPGARRSRARFGAEPWRSPTQIAAADVELGEKHAQLAVARLQKVLSAPVPNVPARLEAELLLGRALLGDGRTGRRSTVSRRSSPKRSSAASSASASGSEGALTGPREGRPRRCLHSALAGGARRFQSSPPDSAGRSQTVRQRALTPPCVGSIPTAPATLPLPGVT